MNSASWVGARAIAGFARLGMLLAIARAYGPGKFGEVSLAISIVEILRTFSEFGVDTVSIRKFAQTVTEERAGLLASVIGTKLLLGSSFYLLGVGVLFLVARNRFEILLGIIAALSLPFVSVLGALSSYFQSSFSMSRMLRTTLVSSAASVGFASVAIHGRVSLLLVIVALPLADGLNLLLLWRQLDMPCRMRLRFQEAMSLLRESLPVGLMAAMIALYFRIDNLFVFKFAGESALGLYALCYRIVEPALMVAHSFSTTSYTLLAHSEHQEDGAGEVSRILVRTMWPAYAFITVVAVIISLSGRILLARFFPAYLSAYPILLVLAFTLLVRTLNVTLTAILNSRARYSTLARITAANLGVNLLLVLLLVQAWGVIGAAWASLLTEGFNALIQGRSVISALVPANRLPVVESVNIE